MTFPLDKHIVDSICRQFGLRNFHELGNASIRQLVGVVKNIEQATGVEYVNMAIGEPGLPADKIGIEAEHQERRDSREHHRESVASGSSHCECWHHQFASSRNL